jgi:putative FmdB family regulatory protein
MPIYEYQCKKCGQFEVMQRITEARLKRCPKCDGKVTKLISNTSFQLKGSGWYATDYARKGTAAGGNGKGGSKSDGQAASSASDKGEAKPEAKSTKSTESATA